MNNPSNKEYVNVVSSASLEDLLLTFSVFKASLAFRASGDDVERSADSEPINCMMDDGILIGEVQCNVLIEKAKGEEQPGDREGDRLFSVDARYTVAFKVTGEHSQDAARAFFNKMAPVAVWPYFRSYVAALAASANVDVPILPLKKLVQSLKAVEGYEEVGPTRGDDK